MFKQQLMNTREAYDACNLRLKTDIDRIGLSYYTFNKAIEQYRDAYAEQREEVELCLFVTLKETSKFANDSKFQSLYAPATQLDILQKGFVGKMAGVSIYFLNPDTTFTERRPQLLGRRALSDSELISRIKGVLEEPTQDDTDVEQVVASWATTKKPSVIMTRSKDGSINALVIDSKEEMQAMLHLAEMMERNIEKFNDMELFKEEIVRIRESLDKQIKENY